MFPNRCRAYYQRRFNECFEDALCELLAECRRFRRQPDNTPIPVVGVEKAAARFATLLRAWATFKPDFPDVTKEVEELLIAVMSWARGMNPESVCRLVSAALVCGERC